MGASDTVLGVSRPLDAFGGGPAGTMRHTVVNADRLFRLFAGRHVRTADGQELPPDVTVLAIDELPRMFGQGPLKLSVILQSDRWPFVESPIIPGIELTVVDILPAQPSVPELRE